jgi:hypothetical protein
MKRKPTTKRPKDTPEAQYDRFLETALAVGADERPEAFDLAFERVAGKPIRTATVSAGRGDRSSRKRGS